MNIMMRGADEWVKNQNGWLLVSGPLFEILEANKGASYEVVRLVLQTSLTNSYCDCPLEHITKDITKFYCITYTCYNIDIYKIHKRYRHYLGEELFRFRSRTGYHTANNDIPPYEQFPIKHNNYGRRILTDMQKRLQEARSDGTMDAVIPSSTASINQYL